MKRTRRQFVQEASALGLLLPILGCSKASDVDANTKHGPENLFEHGVASGDPLTDAVIIWTRLSPDDGETEEQLAVVYEVSTDSEFTDVVVEGETATQASRDFTVKVDVSGLDAGTTYYYRFSAQGRISAVGRTRTAPTGEVERIRLAVMSCSNYAFGYFHGYRHAAQRGDLDAILHLGDYIYEYADGEYGDARALQPSHETVSLADYRQRYSQYRMDPDLQAVHQQVPFITVWDDHELANDASIAGAENHDDSEGDFAERRTAARKAYLEWLPIREQDPESRIFRRFKFGELVDLFMLDTRMWSRVAQESTSEAIAAEDRTLIGDDQLQWLSSGLDESSARWRLLGQQVIMFQLLLGGEPLNPDQWDGYPAARDRLFQMLRDGDHSNIVVLTGDIHASGAAALVAKPADYTAGDASNRLGVELVTPGVTSPFLSAGDLTGALAALQPLADQPEIVVATAMQANPHLEWADGTHQGYLLLDITADRVQAEWYHYQNPEQESVDVGFAKAFSIADGSNLLTEETTPTKAPESSPDLAPTA